MQDVTEGWGEIAKHSKEKGKYSNLQRSFFFKFMKKTTQSPQAVPKIDQIN